MSSSFKILKNSSIPPMRESFFRTFPNLPAHTPTRDNFLLLTISHPALAITKSLYCLKFTNTRTMKPHLIALSAMIGSAASFAVRPNFAAVVAPISGIFAVVNETTRGLIAQRHNAITVHRIISDIFWALMKIRILARILAAANDAGQYHLLFESKNTCSNHISCHLLSVVVYFQILLLVYFVLAASVFADGSMLGGTCCEILWGATTEFTVSWNGTGGECPENPGFFNVTAQDVKEVHGNHVTLFGME